MRIEAKITYPDYKKIQEISRRMDCTISLADFDTSRPNAHRIAVAAGDISRFLKFKCRDLKR